MLFFLLQGVTIAVLLLGCPALLIFYYIFKVIGTVVKESLVGWLGNGFSKKRFIDSFSLTYETRTDSVQKVCGGI